MSRDRIIFALALFCISLASLAIYLRNLISPDIVAYADERKGSITAVKSVRSSEDSVFTHSLVTLTSSTGLTVHCAVLTPIVQRELTPVFILLGGKATGKEAVRYVTDITDVIVVAVDYPYNPRVTYSVGDVLIDLPHVRRAMYDMVPSIQLLIDHFSADPIVDTSRIILAGYSFGAPFVPVSAALDSRIDAGVMAFGAGDLPSLIYHNVRLYEGEAFSRLIGFLSSLILDPLEPLDHIGAISPRPILMINGSEDERMPERNVMMLFDKAREPKALRWIESGHMHPQNTELITDIIRETIEGLAGLGIRLDPRE